jgi:hypothetical protein
VCLSAEIASQQSGSAPVGVLTWGAMKLRAVRIENFRGIEFFEIADLRDLVVIAGPNGCGKTAVLDGIRLLKSFYGGYSLNEWQMWFGEFQIDMNRPEGVLRLFRNRQRQLRIAAEIELSDTDLSFLQENAEDLLRTIVWQARLGRSFGGWRQAVSVTERNQYGEEVERAVQEELDEVRRLLNARSHHAGFTIAPTGRITVDPEPVLELIFQTYNPHELGVIDYHSSSRAYEREALGAVNLNLDQITQQRRQWSLYNSREKYRNVKSELAASYVLGIISEQSGHSTLPDLNITLSELFHTFFPGKEYRGPTPQPDGSLTFLVYLESGGQHDVDELSSGEKELLYGYLRLRNSAPRSSVILLDEPELHLNPRLLQGLPDFYHANLGRALNNQLWLITHSDSILRQVVGNPNYTAFHMSAPPAHNPQQQTDQNQAALVTASSELDQAVLDIVGDLAAYKPRAKVVILEGGGDTETDVEIVSRLFPAWAQSVNLVPGGSKRRVRDLYDILETAKQRAGLSERFFAIVDRDREAEIIPLRRNVYGWDRYHIENYLLENDHVAAACSSVLGSQSRLEGEFLNDALLTCASSLVDVLVLERLQAEVNESLITAIAVNASPNTQDPARDLLPSIDGSLKRLNEIGLKYSEAFLRARQDQIRSTLQVALTNGEWRREFPGRPILRRFVGQYVRGVSYEVYRNIVLDKMVDSGYQPPGMKEVIEKIN